MGHVLWLVPDTIITARLSLPIKGEEKQRKEGSKKEREKDTGDEGKTEGERPDHSTNSPFSPSPAFSLRSPSSPQPTKEHTSPSAFPSLFHPFIFKSKPATSGFPGFGDFGHRTPKPPTAFPSHQQPSFLSSSSFSHTPRHH